MALQLNWKANSRLSSLHSAFCVSTFPDSVQLPASIDRAPFGGLARFAGRLDLSLDRFWELTFQLSLDSNSSQDLAERLAVRALPQPARTPQLLGELRAEISAVMVAFESGFPRFQEEMQFRQAPLREQWEAMGPGLWYQLCSLLEAGLFVETADVCLVMPLVGGFGWAQLQTNRCHIEAVLTNSDPQITEVMRLAWLLGQLDFDRPTYSDLINSKRLRKVAGLAMLPPIFMAAELLGLCSFSSASLQQAIELWRIETSANKSAALAEVLMIWWDTLRSGKTDWSVGLTGLDRMLDE